MPYKIEERNGKHCVIKKPNTVKKCYSDPEKAKDYMAALYANTDKEIVGFTVKQDSQGIWNWIGIVSNNWMDKHTEWISAKAHRRYVDLLDSGEYSEMIRNSWLVEAPGKFGQIFKEIADRGTPDLWYWHIPVPIGYAEWVAYDDRGYLIAVGKQKQGEFYSHVFETIATSDVPHGMSHGMPKVFVNRESDNEQIIGEYLSTELTVLPGDEAANIGTTFATEMKERIMQIPSNKKERMTQIFGEETVNRFDALLGELEIFAEDSEIPRKEKQAMSEQATAEVEETEVEEVETEEVETEETEVEETETETAVDESEAGTNEPDAGTEGQDTGMAMDPATFKVPTDLKAFAQEMAIAMKQVVSDLQATQNAQIEELKKQLDDQRAEIAKLRSEDEDRIARKAAETPIAAMSGWLATEIGSVIGKKEARIHGNNDRELYNKTKVEEPEPQLVPGVAPMISKMITRQQANPYGRTVRVRTADGQ